MMSWRSAPVWGGEYSDVRYVRVASARSVGGRCVWRKDGCVGVPGTMEEWTYVSGGAAWCERG